MTPPLIKWTGRTICKKTHRVQYAAVRDGFKPFEIRSEADVTYNVGDRLCLHEWNEDDQRYVGGYSCRLQRIITYVIRGAWGIPAPLVVLGLQARQTWRWRR